MNTTQLVRATIALVVAFTTTPTPAAEFHVLEEEDGTVHVSVAPLSTQYPSSERSDATTSDRQLSRPLASTNVRSAWRRKLRNTVYVAAKASGLDEALVDAMILVESGYDPAAISHKGAVGLMQLMPETARVLGVKDATDPHQNIMGGTRYLAQLLKEFDSVPLALAAYNAGAGAVRRAQGIPNYPETIDYVRNIMSMYEPAAWR